MEKNQTKKILIIDGDNRVRSLLRKYLEREGFLIDVIGDGQKGLEVSLENDYQLIILDWILPRLEGVAVCEKLRKRKSIPVIMLTSKNDEMSKLRWFEAGVDDYVVKPFSPREFVYRVKALLRRTSTSGDIPIQTAISNVTILPDLTINHNSFTVVIGKKEIQLRRKEYQLLEYMAKAPNRVLSREELIKNVWNYDVYIDNRTVDTHVRRLRKKLASASSKASNMIVTHWGIGYRLEASI